MKLSLFISLFSFFFSSSVFSMNYSFKHMDCKIRYNPKPNDFLHKLALEKLKEKGFIVQSFIEEKRLFQGDLYFNLDYKRLPAKFWKDCLVKISIKKAKGQRVQNKDKTLFKRETKRSLPRHTPKGNERCTRALKDAFIHIPYCQKMSIEEKVKGN